MEIVKSAADKMIEYALSDDPKPGVIDNLGSKLCWELQKDPNGKDKIERLLQSRNPNAIWAVRYAIDELFPGDAQFFDDLLAIHRAGIADVELQLVDFLWEWSDLAEEKKMELAISLKCSMNPGVSRRAKSFLETAK